MCDCIPWFRPGSLSALDPVDALHHVLATTIGSAGAQVLLQSPIDFAAKTVTLSEPPCRTLARLALRHPGVFELCARVVRTSLGATLTRMERRTRAELVEFLDWSLVPDSESERASALFVLVERQQPSANRDPVSTNGLPQDPRTTPVGNPPRIQLAIENNCHVQNNCYIRAHAPS
ncbi:MAG: hypothetical protein QM784_32145 [Polyangiaceae bacterium]